MSLPDVRSTLNRFESRLKQVVDDVRLPQKSPAPAPTSSRAVSDGFEANRTTHAAATPAPAPAIFTPPKTGDWTHDLHTGKRSDPVTIYVHGSLPDLEAALAKGGWSKADPQGMRASERYVGAAAREEASHAIAYAANRLDGVEVGLAGVFGIHLHPEVHQAKDVAGVNRMPVSAQSLDGRKFIEGWECNNNPLGGREHLRIFDTGQRDARGVPVYAIAASRDTGICFAPQHPETGFLFHKVEPDVSAERDRVLSLLSRNANVTDVQRAQVPFGSPSPIGERVGDSTVYDVNLAPTANPRLLGRI